MNDGLLYTHQVVGNAVDRLALGLGRIRERLQEVYQELLHVKGNDIPEDLREDYRFVVDALTGGEGLVDAEKLRATLDQMSDQDAVQVGRRLRQLEDRFNMYVREQEEKQARRRS